MMDTHQHVDSNGDSDSDDDSDIAFASVDFSGVNFDVTDDAAASENELSSDETIALAWEREWAFGNLSFLPEHESSDLARLRDLGQYLAEGKYAQALRGEVARELLEGIVPDDESATVVSHLRQEVTTKGTSVISCLEMEMLGVAALNLFLQSNYTGPLLDDDDEASTLAGINPHSCFASRLNASSAEQENKESHEEEKKENLLTASRRNTNYQNAVLSELAVDGEWPCQVCHHPYFLLVARSILSTLADPTRPVWNHIEESGTSTPSSAFALCSSKLSAVKLWNGRAVIAHERLLQEQEPSLTLWNEAEWNFQQCIDDFCPRDGESSTKPNPQAATVMLEKGLAEHHFDRRGKGKKSFEAAQAYSGLELEVTGAVGKRTKFQQQAMAQMLVRAKSAAVTDSLAKLADKIDQQDSLVKSQMVDHSEDTILLDKIKFEDDKENEVTNLTVLDQAILLAFCLDVKNSNPADGLTSEQMGAFVARALEHHDDWMVYATGLLERSWLEFERSHASERAVLQIQALVDQHTNRLTLTQSTRQSIEESAHVQDRLKNLHTIVYPPRWSMIADLANRYANMGIVTSAAELYTEIEFWDEVVECYRRAGKVSKAEQIVRERLAAQETPRMWAALGDLTNDPEHYRRSIELSKGRFSDAYVALGKYYFEKGELVEAASIYEKALVIRPLAPAVWFRLGTISMQLGRWETALRAFSQVVQQEPEEAEAWANVAAVHMHNKQPAEAYPALVESLKHNRNNWRVWISKLYTCLDLQRYDEAIQACNVVLDLKGNGAPELEEKCVRAIVGGAVNNFHSCSIDDDAALDSARRTLTRVDALLERISSTSQAKPWVFETMAFLHEQVGNDEKAIIENLMKEYRSLQAAPGWEKDDIQMQKVCQVVSYIAQIHVREGSRESLTKARFLVKGVIKKILLARGDHSNMPEELVRAENILGEIESKLQNL